MTTFPNSPRILKGALIGIETASPIPSVIIFQYNPDTLTRSLQARASRAARARAEQQRLTGPPRRRSSSTSRSTRRISSRGRPDRGSLGVYPQLSALEMLIYPKSALVIANTALHATGTIEVIPPNAPLMLFIWGPKRMLPVR